MKCRRAPDAAMLRMDAAQALRGGSADAVDDEHLRRIVE
jgi:hypothetical protein